VSDQGNFDQRPGETAEAWLARLRAVSQEGMVMHQRFSYQHQKEGAERLVKQSQKPPGPLRSTETPPPGNGTAGARKATPGTLESVKDAFRHLTQEERQQFALWLSQGMPGD
jgi:hypothetical protein